MSDADPGAAPNMRAGAAVAALLRARSAHFARRDAAAERSALARLAHELALESQVLQQSIADLVCELCGADGVVVALHETGADGEAVRWSAASGKLAGHAGARWRLDDCPCGHTIRAGEPELFERPGEQFESLRSAGAGLGISIGEILGVPWRVRGRTAGVLAAMLADGGAHFDADDMALLEACADFAAASHQAHAQAESRLTLQREVDESRAAERALREHKALVDATLCIGTVGVAYFDLDGTIRDVNPAFESMSGYAREELLSLSHWQDMTPPEFWQTTARARRDLAEIGVTIPYTKQMFRKDGSRWWGLFAPARISGSGIESHCVMFVIDVTENMQAEDALRASEARFRALADASPALVYQFDLDGNLIYLNQRCMAGPPAEGESGAACVGWRSIPRPEDMDGYLRTVFEGIRKYDSYTRRIHTVVRGGGWHWFEAHAAPWYSGEGEHRGYVGISLDVTGKVEAEEALKDADRRKDEFLATLAHELRNPLAPISNAVQLMRRPDGRRQSDRVVEMVGRQVRQIVRLVDDLMEVSRITRGKIDLKLERVPFADIVHSAVETSQLMIERAGHQLAVSLPQEPLMLEADRLRLTQVFANLLNNAAKYTDPGGRIWLELRREGSEAVASVRDTGIGIPLDALPRVFDMFAQVHRSVGRGQGGLGIGLTMVRSLVEMHHGTVEARSAGNGQGSEFIVRLPLAAGAGEETAGDPGPAAAHAPFAGQRILVVDDNRDAADTLGLLLESDGAEVRVVYDGRAALAMAESFRPTSVLLDIGMPGMDGFEVARRLRQDERFAALRIVALTGWGKDTDRRQTHNRGFSHHLTKPVSIEDLQQVLV
jgi:PAS domain S-box-containing protein